jgi:hypothetical protein
MKLPKNTRITWNADALGPDGKPGTWRWYVPFVHPRAAESAAIRIFLPMLIQRWRAMGHGLEKDRYAAAVKRLRDDRAFVQHVTGERGDGKGDLAVFEADERPAGGALISIPGFAS